MPASTTTLTLCYYKRTDESPALGSRTKGRFLWRGTSTTHQEVPSRSWMSRESRRPPLQVVP